ncbi:MAG: valyl-tRNA synthetase, partial [Candidatus Regiella insecticola]|nr:valyl-tRNA synthetase [Candidatus Regiella insecticola]
ISLIKLVEGAEILIPMRGFLDKTSELDRLAKEMIKLDLEIERIEVKLANEDFIARAPQAVVSKERERLAACIQDKEKLLAQQTMIAEL